MRLILQAFGIFFTVYFLVVGQFMDVVYLWMLIGLVWFVWEALMDGLKFVGQNSGGDHYHLTQNKFDLGESDDPTRPNENIPAIIEIGKHYRDKS